MPWIFSVILYHESVKIYDKSIDMLKWMQVGLRVPGAGSVPLRERQAQSRKFEFFQEKWESRWGCGDRAFLLINDLVRRSSCHIMYLLGNHLNQNSSPKNVRGASVQVIRHYIWLTGKICVHSGASTWMFHLMDQMYISDSKLRKYPIRGDL